MEEAKRRGALYQSSAGSLWCCLWLRSSQGRAQVQCRAGSYTRSSCQASCLGCACFPLGELGWDGTQLTLLAAGSGALGCGMCWGSALCCWGHGAMLTHRYHGSSEQTGAVLRDSIPCSCPQHSHCSADTPWQAGLTGSTLFCLARANKGLWCIKCHLMDTGVEDILHLAANINTAWCLTLWRVHTKGVIFLKMSLNRNEIKA